MLNSNTSKLLAGLLSLAISAPLVGGYLLQETHRAPLEVERARLAQLTPFSALYLLEREGESVGVHSIAVAPVDSAGEPRQVRVEERAEIDIPVPGGGTQHAIQESVQFLDEHLRLNSWSFLVRAGADEGAAQSTLIEGKRLSPLSDSMQVDISTGGSTRSLVLHVGPDVVMGSGVWPRILLSGALREGARLRLGELDPTTLAVRTMELEVGTSRLVPSDSARAEDDPLFGVPEGDLRAFEVRQVVGGLTYDLLIGTGGLPLHASLPLEMRARPASAAEVLALAQEWRDRSSGAPSYAMEDEGRTLIAQSAIAAGAEIDRARDIDFLQVLSSGVDIPVGAHGGVQRVSGDTIEVRRLPFPPAGRAGYSLTSAGRESLLRGDAEVARMLDSEPFIESDHPDIIRATESVVGGMTDPVEATRRISDFVYRHLTKSYTASLPSAIEAFYGEAGDCNEHTMLVVAMLRAAGVPARPVSGLAYVDGSFYFHAWGEAWLGGRWVPVDPTFGVAPADPARVRLFVGRENINAVLPLVGKLNLQVLRSGNGAPSL